MDRIGVQGAGVTPRDEPTLGESQLRETAIVGRCR
jgi:hypothetical protein